MNKIAYISNLDYNKSSGGWSGINVNMYNQLKKYFRVEYIGPINPPFVYYEKVISKIIRNLGFRGGFSFFSEKRLQKINELYSCKCNSTPDFYFFFGNTPWIKIKPNKPYFVYMDADFITYLKVFSDYPSFSEKSIKRIANQEKIWLENAHAIFFGSHWIMNETIKNLDLPNVKNKYKVVNTGGHIPIPEKDNYQYRANDLKLLFISLNFEKKGGHDAVNIFLEIKKTLPNTILTIIGERPPEEVLNTEGIQYIGRLSKSKTDELNKMEQEFQKASFLIHPTKMDTMGAIIPEANYFGTPAVASNRFGIPDLIQDENTGILIDDEEDYAIVASKIITLFMDKTEYMDTRKNARNFAIGNFSWDAIGEKINQFIVNKS
jgi:glycosyltransferase involved in cell wall biosynthesis